ncbi:LOW QUALITY PROTEIN: ret finger protein-like 3 [Dugong dugon]
MAELFQGAGCPVCQDYFEKPVHLKWGYTCCLHCITVLEKEPQGEILSCPKCLQVCLKSEISPGQLGKLVSKIKELEPQLRVTLQMNPRMLKFQVDMTLDVDTAKEFPIISDDLRSVRCEHIRQNRQKHTERFNKALGVLGSLKFTSGHHHWEVDVGTSQEWHLGVCRESVDRKGPIVLNSELGFWTVSLRKGVISASTVPRTIFWMKLKLHQVGIFLDVDFGNLSFFNMSDGSHVFTFTNISAMEMLCPFFGLSKPNNGGPQSLTICTLKNPGIEILQEKPGEDI